MKIKIGDLTIKQVHRICEKCGRCSNCPIESCCNTAIIMSWNIEKEIEIPEELLK